MAVDPVSINGNQFDWGSLIFKLNGDLVNGVSAVKFGDKRERAKAYGAGKAHKPRGRTRGKYSAEGSLTLWADTADAFRNRLCLLSGSTSYGNAVFQFVIQRAEAGLSTATIELVDCCVAGDDSDESESPDPSKVEFGLDIMYIRRNGQTLYDSTGEGIGAAAVAALQGVVGGL